MALVAEVRVGGAVLLGHTLRSAPDATLETQYQATAEAYTFAVEGEFDAVEAALREDPTVADARLIADPGERRIYRVDPTVEREIISEAAAGLDVQIVSATGEGGEWTIRLRAPDRAALAALKEFCDDHDVAFRVERVYAEEGTSLESPLTPAQRELLVTAYREGYFDEPRGASLAEVADELGVSSSAASGRLRRAMRALVEATMTDEVGADE